MNNDRVFVVNNDGTAFVGNLFESTASQVIKGNNAEQQSEIRRYYNKDGTLKKTVHQVNVFKYGDNGRLQSLSTTTHTVYG